MTPGGGVKVARATPRGEAAGPRPMVARLAGCDPLLWQAEQAGGAVTLGAPYAEADPRCALSGKPIARGAPLELYYHGRPLSPEQALPLAPLLAFLRAAVATAGSALEELGGLAGVENTELRAILAERAIRQLVGRVVGMGAAAAGSGGGVAEGDRAAGE